jgi:hypothetical protein
VTGWFRHRRRYQEPCSPTRRHAAPGLKITNRRPAPHHRGSETSTKRVATLPHPLAAYLAAAALATALVLYVSTLYAYDSLLMPTRFWATAVAKHQRRSSVVERPPSSANLVLQQNMINIWNRQFTIANLLVIAGFGLLAWGILKIAPWWVLGAVAMACVVAFFGRQINLGTQD